MKRRSPSGHVPSRKQLDHVTLRVRVAASSHPDVNSPASEKERIIRPAKNAEREDKKKGRSTDREKERLRRSYRPAHLRILFVGESPPASGRFFYQADSGLYRAIRNTFRAAFPVLREDDFLHSFQNLGCYLVDLCGKPVDCLNTAGRRQACRDGEPRLARTIKELQPKIVITVVRSISANVRRAQASANWKGLIVELPYPGRWKEHRIAFEDALKPVLRKELPRPKPRKE